MDFSKYKLFYVNGSSNVVGGGLEEPEIRPDSFRPVYEKLYGVTWKNREEVNFAKRLSDIIGVKHINDGECGGGSERVVRRSYEFLDKYWHIKDKIFLILEKPHPDRCDVFYSKNKEYYIVNAKKENNERYFHYATRRYYDDNKHKEDVLNQNVFNDWFNNHFDFEEAVKKDDYLFTGLYSFCKLNNVKIFLMGYNELYFPNCYDKKDIITFENDDRPCSVNGWCNDNNLTINGELKHDYKDSHPGYFGHMEYAKKLSKFLENYE